MLGQVPTHTIIRKQTVNKLMKKEEGKKEGDVFTIRGKKATMEGGKVTTKWLGSWSLRYSELKREDFLIPSSTVSQET